MADRRLEVTYSTMGQQNPSQVTLSKPYRWQGIEDWEPGDPRFRETVPASRTLGGMARTYGREQRVARFADALAKAGHQAGQDVPLKAVIEAGASVGVGEKTARSYLSQIRKRQPGGSHG